MSYEEVMQMPIRTFWLMNSNIERVSAQKDMRSIAVAVCSMGGEAVQEVHRRLVIETGTIAKLKLDPIRDAVRDEQGIAVLKEMAKQKR
jgi:hypothetical protein